MNVMESQSFESSSQSRLPAYLVYLINHKHVAGPDDFPSLEKLKREYILYLLRFTNSNLNETAKILSISRPALAQKIKRLGLAL